MNPHQQLMLGYSGNPKDPFFANVLTLINGNSAAGIVDVIGRSISINNSSITSSDTDFPYGGIRFSSTPGSSYIKYNTPSWFSLTGDFTIEMDYKPLSKPAGSTFPTLISTYLSFGANGGLGFFDRHSSSPTLFSIALNGSFPALSSLAAVSNNTLYQVAITRSGSTVRLFINGVLQGSTTFAGTVTSSGNSFTLGLSENNGNSYTDSIIGKFRVTTVARYTANYTPTRTPFPTS